jgi:hypothetical protein
MKMETKDFNVLCGMILTKVDRPDVTGKIMSYDDDLEEFYIVFKETSGLRWETHWSVILMFRNLGDSWDVIKSSPVMDGMYDI